MGLRPYQNSRNLLFQVCIITIYLFPGIAHQNYYNHGFFVADSFKLMSSISALIKNYKVPLATTIKVLQYMFAAICFLYTYIIFNLYFLATITPCLLSIFSYQFGTLENVNLTLPIPINNVLNLGPIYYSLLIYQTTEIYISISVAIICFSTYLVFINHACCQLSVIRFKIGHPFKGRQKFIQIRNDFDWIVDVIKRHERIMGYVDFLNSCTKRIYLIEIFFIMLFIILDFLYIFQVSSTLINHSVEARDELCKIPFYILSIRVQKLLLFLILRWSKPCVLSIGGMFVMSHKAFAGKRCLDVNKID
ncbi:uncharacterized protein LOC124953539 [Vespa velutina]|uniref:uncharacterized protein LOC124953539 n=1 Tax=Vespa velutina TaxID=202808 RepID=UPI001FB4BFF4|nr:uncharacterized protein LOC124953539 [Vespa velutina]